MKLTKKMIVMAVAVLPMKSRMHSYLAMRRGSGFYSWCLPICGYTCSCFVAVIAAGGAAMVVAVSAAGVAVMVIFP